MAALYASWVGGSANMVDMITNGTKEWVGAGYIIDTNPDTLVDKIIEGIEAKRAALGI